MNGTVEDPLEWRAFTDRDFQAARALSQSDDVEIFDYIIAFHAHQSAEKYFKGLLMVTGGDLPRIHVLPDLLRRAIAHIPDLDSRELRVAATNLNNYYIPSRYPAEVGGPSGPITAEEASEALAWAEDVAVAV